MAAYLLHLLAIRANPTYLLCMDSKKPMRHTRPSVSASILAAVKNRNKRPTGVTKVVRNDTVIASYNVHKCVGIDKKFDPDRIAHVIGELGADVVAVQEADKRFGERSGLLDLARLERENNLVPVRVASLYPKGHGWHGNLLLFREGVVRRVQQLKLPGLEPRGALVVDLDLEAGPLRIIAAHLGLLRHSRMQQSEAILNAVHADPSRPTLLLGDLNEWRIGKGSSLHFLHPVFDPMKNAVPSFPSRFPVLALDRVLGHPHSLVTGIEVHDTPLARVASDHLPIKAYVDLKGALAETADIRDRASLAR
ncbi:endonuclease/exonuclease/phosphatase family metal-dependent hydrolase [Phyllobacterium myrsinacearum]|nr:endonuclease/exonuclease/phosphatase family metal-dependent hydrolase [Phyllobacterium myrsinacearum]RZS87863.1 endonuclease/exonuclease/phosphatase family metal-dependent hydrolase [Phyllobacterium myrsinacearum]RZV07098.1 endonuclease/exonuclease/phosphatase family metal-dependent hydrolase [Phyllobacterium myrsinacearum]